MIGNQLTQWINKNNCIMSSSHSVLSIELLFYIRSDSLCVYLEKWRVSESPIFLRLLSLYHKIFYITNSERFARFLCVSWKWYDIHERIGAFHNDVYMQRFARSNVQGAQCEETHERKRENLGTSLIIRPLFSFSHASCPPASRKQTSDAIRRSCQTLTAVMSALQR